MNPRRSQGGQMLVESVLLMALLASITLLVQAKLNSSGFLNNLISKPWASVAGMIECGTWAPCKAGQHPSTRNRNLSLDPDGAR